MSLNGQNAYVIIGKQKGICYRIATVGSFAFCRFVYDDVQKSGCRQRVELRYKWLPSPSPDKCLATLRTASPPRQHAAADTARYVHRAGTACRARRRTKTDSLLQDARGIHNTIINSYPSAFLCYC